MPVLSGRSDTHNPAGCCVTEGGQAAPSREPSHSLQQQSRAFGSHVNKPNQNLLREERNSQEMLLEHVLSHKNRRCFCSPKATPPEPIKRETSWFVPWIVNMCDPASGPWAQVTWLDVKETRQYKGR